MTISMIFVVILNGEYLQNTSAGSNQLLRKLIPIGTNVGQGNTIYFAMLCMLIYSNILNSSEYGAASIFKKFFEKCQMLINLLIIIAVQYVICEYGQIILRTEHLDFIIWIKIFLLSFCVIIMSEIIKIFWYLIKLCKISIK
jgi:Ca2+-transporting ATPase